MKKLFTIAISIALFNSVKSQTLYVEGGVNFSKITTPNPKLAKDNNLLTTMHVGAMVRFNMAGPVALESGLLVDGKGSRTQTYFSVSPLLNYMKTKFNPIYLEVPVNVVYRHYLKNKISNIFINAGPYIAMGIGGKSSVRQKYNDDRPEFLSSQDIQFNNDKPSNNFRESATYRQLKRFDYGINLGGGFDFGKVLIKANYGIGLADINSKTKINTSTEVDQYRVLSISLGVPLRGN